MNNRKAKRMLNESNEWVLFTTKRKEDTQEFYLFISSAEAWEILLHLAIDEYHIRETFRNILKTADEYLEDNGNQAEP
jgi:hypothetical protein